MPLPLSADVPLRVSSMPEYKKGTHLLASRTGHLEWPSKERFQCVPIGAHFSDVLCVKKFSRFQCGQQPKLRENGLWLDDFRVGVLGVVWLSREN
jgi:hypothetical protein